MKFRSKTEKETLALAARLARHAAPGVIALSGPLGGGKTTFVRGFLRGLGYKGVVPSPTFALVNVYRRVKPRVYHLDLYRIEHARELGGVGLEDYLDDERAVSFIEWPDVAKSLLPSDRLEISFAHARDGGRRLTFRARGKGFRKVLAALSKGKR